LGTLARVERSMFSRKMVLLYVEPNFLLTCISIFVVVVWNMNGWSANLVVNLSRMDIKMGKLLTIEEVQSIVTDIHFIELQQDSLKNLGLIDFKVRSIRDGGWKLKIEAYTEDVINTETRGVSSPKLQWRCIAWFVCGDEKVWYFNRAGSKTYAMRMQSLSDK
jgi:hypothetical protein